MKYVFFFCLWAVCQADLTNLDRYLLEILKGTESPLKKYDNDCVINGTAGSCVRTSQCNLKGSNVDPATTFILREKDSLASVVPDNTVQQNCGSLKVCCPLGKELTETHKVKNQPNLGCGYSNPGANVFREMAIAYGFADFGDFPWMIALLLKKKGESFGDQYIGGGVLIHPSVVITVAHKVETLESPTDLTCRAGEWNATSELEIYKHQDRHVKHFVIHKEYVRAYMHYAAALLILQTPYDLEGAPHIGVACLEQEMPAPGTTCYSMGWGKEFIKGNLYSSILKKIELKLVPSQKCQDQYRNSQLGRRYVLHRSLTCAGGQEGVDTCANDGGSPLVCSIPDKDRIRYSVVGMVAYGLNCGTENLPGVYVKVPSIYEWVINEMTNLNYNTSTFEYH